MALKKFNVHVSYHTYIDVPIIADEDTPIEDIIEDARQKAAENDPDTIDEIIANCVEDGNTETLEIEDVFKERKDAYNALCEVVNAEDGYVYIDDANQRPQFTTIEYTGYDGMTRRKTQVTIKSLVMTNDESSPLKMIDDEDAIWDVDDYLNLDDMTTLYGVLKFDYIP